MADDVYTGLVAVARDITEQAQAEETLRIERDNLKNIFEAMNDGIYIVDQEYNIEYVNPVLVNEFGAYEGRKCYAYFHDRDDVCPWCKNPDVFAGKTVHWEWTSAKNQKTYDLIDTPLQNHNGSISKLEIFRDITKRVEVEQVLRESEAKLRAILDASPDIIHLLDSNGIILSSNEAFATRMGLELDTVIGKRVFDYGTPKSQPKRKAALAKVFRTGEPLEFETAGLDNLFESHLNPVFNAQGIVTAVAMYGRDITDSKKAEQDLKESEEKFRVIYANMATGVARISLDFHILGANQAYCQMLGYEEKELIGKHLKEFTHPEMIEENLRKQAQLASGETEHYRMDKDFLHRSGRVIHGVLDANLVRNLAGEPAYFLGSVLDFTERKQAETQLKLQSHALESVANAIVITDAEGDIQWVNSAFSTLTGYSFDEALRQNPRVLKSGEQDDSFYKAMWGTISKGEIWHDTLVNKRKDGSFYTEEMTIAPLVDDEGRISNFVAIKRNVSERIRAEKELAESELKFRLLANHTYDWEYWINPEGKYIYLSPACERISGYSPDEFKANPKLLYDLVRPDYAEEVHQHYEDENNKETPVFSVNFSIIAKNGEERWLAHNCSPIFDDGGNYLGRRGNNRDITEQMIVDNKLQAALELNESIVETSPIGIAIYNIDGDCLAANNAIAEMVGATTKAQILAQNYHQLDSWKGSGIYDMALKAMREKRKQHLETQVQTSFGKKRALDIYLAPVKIAKESHLLITVSDISERMQAEEEKRQLEMQLRQHQKLEAIGTLASGVAHEINNPIMGIMNYATLISERLDPSQSQLREFAKEIGSETERVAEIVRNLLTFSRQEKQSHSPARMIDIANDTLSLVRAVMRHDQITLEVAIPDDLPKIQCRSQQIQQVLMNLFTNARDALNERYLEYDPDKLIKLSVKIFEKNGRQWLRTTVEDHGAGIPAEIRERVFDPFYTTKDRATGTGLGLSISLGIIQDHHGELTFESEEGQPTRFYLDLPVDNGWERSQDI